MACNGIPLSVEISAEDFVVLTLKTKDDGSTPEKRHVAWLSEALQHQDFVALHRSEDGLALTVGEAFLAEATPPKDLLGSVAKYRANKLKVDVKVSGAARRDLRFALETVPASSGFAVASATLGNILQEAAIPFNCVAHVAGDGESWYIHQRDIAAAGQALVRAGHAIRPSRRFWPSSSPDVAEALDVAFATSASSNPTGRRRSHQHLQSQRFAGAFRLLRREIDPLHLGGGGRRPRQEGKGSDNAPIRLQAGCGVYVEVDCPNQPVTASAAVVDEASVAGRLSFLGDTTVNSDSPTIVERHRLVDFQPPGPGRLVPTSMQLNGDLLVDDGGEEGYHDTWTRLQDHKQGSVALELVHEHPPRSLKRHGYWLFCGSYFARVVGPPLGQGVVAGTCCSSLRQLRRLHGEAVVRTDLSKHYEACFGCVEKPGLLRIQRRSLAYLKDHHQGPYLYDAAKGGRGGGGKIVVGDDLTEDLIHHLPDGTEQHWRKLEWAFDPFALDADRTSANNSLPAHPETKTKDVVRADRSRSRSTRSKMSPHRKKVSAAIAFKAKRPSTSSSSDASDRSETRKLGMGLMHAPPALGSVARKLSRPGEETNTVSHTSRQPAKIFQQAKEHANKFAAMDIVLKMASARAAKEEDPASQPHPALMQPDWPAVVPPPAPPSSPDGKDTRQEKVDSQTSQLLAALADAEHGAQGAGANSDPLPHSADIDDGTTEEEDFVAEAAQAVPGPPSEDDEEDEDQDEDGQDEEEEDVEDDEEDEIAKKRSAKALEAARAAAEATNRRVRQKAEVSAGHPSVVGAAAEAPAPVVPQYIVLHPGGPNQPPVVFAVAPTGGAASAVGAAGSSGGPSITRVASGSGGYVIDEAGNLVPGNQKVVDDFIKCSGFDRRATAAVKSLPFNIQVQMAQEGRVEGKNPSAVIMSRIKQYEAQKQIAEALEADKKAREQPGSPPGGASVANASLPATSVAATPMVGSANSSSIAVPAPVVAAPQTAAASPAAAAGAAAAPAQPTPQYTIAMMQLYPGSGMVPVAIPAAYSVATTSLPSWPSYAGAVSLPAAQYGRAISSGQQPSMHSSMAVTTMVAPAFTQPGA